MLVFGICNVTGDAYALGNASQLQVFYISNLIFHTVTEYVQHPPPHPLSWSVYFVCVRIDSEAVFSLTVDHISVLGQVDIPVEFSCIITVVDVISFVGRKI